MSKTIMEISYYANIDNANAVYSFNKDDIVDLLLTHSLNTAFVLRCVLKVLKPRAPPFG